MKVCCRITFSPCFNSLFTGMVTCSLDSSNERDAVSTLIVFPSGKVMDVVMILSADVLSVMIDVTANT